VTGAADANEGQTKTFSFDTTDPGVEDTFTQGTPDCGIGSFVSGSLVFSTMTGDGSFDCKFTDDDPTGTPSDPTTVSIRVTDDDSGSGTGSHALTMHNVAPTVAVTGATYVDEGQTETFNFDTTDPGTADTFTHGAPDCGTGSLVGTVTFSSLT